jgi:DDB1- and CUL4-associated factor 7
MSLPFYEMRPYGHQHSSSSSGRFESTQSQSNQGNGLYQVTPTLGSTSTPTGSNTRISAGSTYPMSSGGQTASLQPGGNQASSPRGLNRPQEELHMPPSYSAMSQQQSSPYSSPQDTPRGGQAHTSGGMSLPNSLHPGHGGRPAPATANTAPSTVSTLPPISAQSQQYSTPSRASTASQSHNYSRSSPSTTYGRVSPHVAWPRAGR